jgi:hypothetical protein
MSVEHPVRAKYDESREIKSSPLLGEHGQQAAEEHAEMATPVPPNLGGHLKFDLEGTLRTVAASACALCEAAVATVHIRDEEVMQLRAESGCSSDFAYFRGSPAIPPAKPQGIPTLKISTAKAWPQGRTPTAVRGLTVNAFASGLKHPRWIHVLPSGEVLVAEVLTESVPIKSAASSAHATWRAFRRTCQS